nr:MAG TPA: hypothetical protein [Caudoviricetes sp.]
MGTGYGWLIDRMVEPFERVTSFNKSGIRRLRYVYRENQSI